LLKYLKDVDKFNTAEDKFLFLGKHSHVTLKLFNFFLKDSVLMDRINTLFFINQRFLRF
jgi:hypothetical protein